MINPFLKTLEEAQREAKELQKQFEKALGHIFAGKIKANFLLDIWRQVKEKIGCDLSKYFDFNVSDEKIVSGTDDSMTIDYEICRHIVGAHRSNLVFLSEAERVAKEKNSAYREQLVNDVIENIKLCPYAGVLFRKCPIMAGESFIYFPLPYDLFAISIRINNILLQNKSQDDLLRPLYVHISNKCSAALSMLEDNFLDNAYPICRGAMELYTKMLLLLNEPQVIDDFFKFSEYELRQSCCEQTYLDEFNKRFDNRAKHTEHNKVEYLHFGWVDNIANYHKLVKQKPYTINGVITYLRSKYEDTDKQFFDHIEILYKMCHGYTHGNINISKYPILHYFEISIMLYYILSHTYKIVCEQYDVSTKIDDIERDFEQVGNQYSQRSTINFENYYKRNP